MLTWWWWDPQLLFSDGFTFRPGPSSKFGFNSFEIQNLTFLVIRVWKLVPLVGAQCSFSALSAVGPCVDPTVDLQWETAGSYKMDRPQSVVGATTLFSGTDHTDCRLLLKGRRPQWKWRPSRIEAASAGCTFSALLHKYSVWELTNIQPNIRGQILRGQVLLNIAEWRLETHSLDLHKIFSCHLEIMRWKINFQKAVQNH